MIFELRIVEKVYNQLNEAVIYYELQQVGLGKNLLVEFKLAIENIVLNPFGHEKNTNNLGIPYLIDSLTY